MTGPHRSTTTSLPISLPPSEECQKQAGYKYQYFSEGYPDLAKCIASAFQSDAVDTAAAQVCYDNIVSHIEKERDMIFRRGFESFRGVSINGDTNHTDGSMASTLELAAPYYRKDPSIVQPGQPIPQAWESMQQLVQVGMQLFTIVDSLIVEGLVKCFEPETRKGIKGELEKIKGIKRSRRFDGISERAVCPPIQDEMKRGKIRDTCTGGIAPRPVIDIVDPPGGVSDDIVIAMRCTNFSVNLPNETIMGSGGATFNLETETFSANSCAWGVAERPLQQVIPRQKHRPGYLAWRYDISEVQTGLFGKPMEMVYGYFEDGKWISPGNCDDVDKKAATAFAKQHRRPIPGTDPPSTPGGATNVYHLILQLLHKDQHSMASKWMSYMLQHLLPRIERNGKEDEVFIQWMRALGDAVKTRTTSDTFAGAAPVKEEDVRILAMSLLDKMQKKHYSVTAINLASNMRKQLTKLPKDDKLVNMSRKHMDLMINERRVKIASEQVTFELPKRLSSHLANSQDRALINGNAGRGVGISAMYGPQGDSRFGAQPHNGYNFRSNRDNARFPQRFSGGRHGVQRFKSFSAGRGAGTYLRRQWLPRYHGRNSCSRRRNSKSYKA